MVLLLVVVRADAFWLQCLSPVLCWAAFSPSLMLKLNNSHVVFWEGWVHMWKLREYVFLPQVQCNLINLKKDNRVKSRFPSSELLLWPHKRPPHWDYLVICSPNFYEVAFPLWFFILFNFSCFTLLRFWGHGLPSEGFIVLICFSVSLIS